MAIACLVTQTSHRAEKHLQDTRDGEGKERVQNLIKHSPYVVWLVDYQSGRRRAVFLPSDFETVLTEQSLCSLSSDALQYVIYILLRTHGRSGEVTAAVKGCCFLGAQDVLVLRASLSH